MADDARVPALKDLLELFEASSEKAGRARTGMLELLYVSKHPFERDHDTHHFTASALVLSRRGVLLHKHKRSGEWLQPGGHIDGDEQPVDAAIRETLEETGVRVHNPAGGPQLLNVDVHHTVNGHVHYDLAYLFASDGEDPNPPEGESPDVGWFSVEEALSLTDDVCRNLIVTASGRSIR
jgi:8-oxo-dGTP pyrophosphatase MutT (NUDIX family)